MSSICNDEKNQPNETLRFIWLHTFRNLIGPRTTRLPFLEANRPRILTVARFLFVLAFFLIVGIAAAVVPVESMRIVVAVLGILTTAALCILLILDIRNKKGKQFIP